MDKYPCSCILLSCCFALLFASSLLYTRNCLLRRSGQQVALLLCCGCGCGGRAAGALRAAAGLRRRLRDAALRFASRVRASASATHRDSDGFRCPRRCVGVCAGRQAVVEMSGVHDRGPPRRPYTKIEYPPRPSARFFYFRNGNTAEKQPQI